jgi:glutathione S-transferase
MKLYVTPTSPYARLAMIARLDLGLEDSIELVWTKTRVADDPVLSVNPSGRIPFLQFEDGTGFEDTDVIVEYLDRLAEPRRYARPELAPELALKLADAGDDAYWRFRRLEASARSMLDGVSVWAREIKRPVGEQSPDIIAHEGRRADRLAHTFDDEIGFAPLALTGDGLNIVQMLLFCALDVHRRVPEMDWRDDCPGLSAWYDRMVEIPAVGGSLPPSEI